MIFAKWYVFSLLILLLSAGFQPQAIPKHNTIIESNHFYSNYELNTTYSISNVKKGLSMILTLKKKQQNQILKYPITISLHSGSNSIQCKMNSYNSLCVLQQIIKQQMQMKINCQKLPCQVSWLIVQNSLQQLNNNDNKLNKFFKISSSQNHMIIMLTCNNANLQNISNSLHLYSNNKYQNASLNHIFYYMFTNQEKGYVYISATQQIQLCLKMSIYNILNEIQATKQIRDFISVDKPSVFKLKQQPSNDFRIQCSMHELYRISAIESSLKISLTAQNNKNERQTLIQIKITPKKNEIIYDYNLIIKQIDKKKYKNLELEFRSTKNLLMLNFKLIQSSRQEVELNQISYFILKKKQKIKYLLINQNQNQNQNNKKDSNQNNQYTYIVLSNKRLFNSSQSKCLRSKGCEFQIQALSDATGSLELSPKQTVQNKKQILFTTIQTSIKKRIHQDDQLYFKKHIIAKKVLKVVVNSPNLIIFVSRQNKCQIPSMQCYEKIFNSQCPFYLQPQQDGELMLMIKGLDNTQFILTCIQENNQFIQLKDGQAFIYVMNEKQQEIKFQFKLNKKEEVSFNLIAPLNSLSLAVINDNKQPKSQDTDLFESDGYIQFNKKQIEKLQFIAIVKKRKHYKKIDVHFTFIVSTKSSNLRLDPGNTHYETLSVKKHRDYIFEFELNKQYALNFYIHNLKQQKINIEMLVSNQDKWNGDKGIVRFTINQASDALEMKDVSEKLCKQQGSLTCEIFLRLYNAMDIQVEISITLMMRDAIIELKQGLWQSYKETSIIHTAHFFFYPKHNDKSISIMYRSLFTDLRILYKIFKTDDKSINPSYWPFPQKPQQNEYKNTLYKPIKFLTIQKQLLKNCWPECIILISLLKDSTSIPGQYDSYIEFNDFAIMISNNLIELPQKNKLDIMIKVNQQKIIMVDLKYYLEKQILTFFIFKIIGFYSIQVNVYSEKKQRCPSNSQENDYTLNQITNQISIASIKSKLLENQMNNDKDISLCILVQAYSNSKFNIEFISDEKDIKTIQLDTFETIKMKSKEQKIYRVNAVQQYYLKFMRNNGFPFIKIINCQNNKDEQKCIDELKKDNNNKGKQIISKTQSYTQKPCQKCFIFIKLFTEQPAEINIHLQSKYTQIQLQENKIITDFTNENQQNRYLLLVNQQEQTIINIQVMQGNPQIEITDLNKIQIKKSLEQNKNLIHIVIPSQNPNQLNKYQDQIIDKSFMSALSLSMVFNNLHVIIRSKQKKLSTSYTIVYSSGEREIYLQDGIITDYSLQSTKIVTFYYENQSGEGHLYLTLSMQKSSNLFNLKIKIYSLKDINDQQSKVEIDAKKPPMRKNTPNPIILFELPAQKLFIIEITNPSEKLLKVSIGINHRQVMLLPFQHSFPFTLHPKEDINFLVDVNNIGYLKVFIRKCDQSQPEFSYTFDYKAFQSQQFTYIMKLNQDPHFEYFIKANKIGVLYINIKTEQASLLSIQVSYSAQKQKNINPKAGNKGILQYNLIDSSQAEISFTGIVCQSKKKCKQNIQYYTMSSTKLQDLYMQTVCPSSYFSILQAKSIKPLPLQKITNKNDHNQKISFKYKLMDQISYVAVKAITKQGQQIYYKPIEIVTVWGQITKNKYSYKSLLFILIFIGICVGLICFRRNSRKNYIPLQEDD